MSYERWEVREGPLGGGVVEILSVELVQPMPDEPDRVFATMTVWQAVLSFHRDDPGCQYQGFGATREAAVADAYVTWQMAMEGT